MRTLKYSLLFVLLSCAWFPGAAQHDSLYTDTVVIQKQPFVLKKQILAPDWKAVDSTTSRLALELLAGGGATIPSTGTAGLALWAGGTLVRTTRRVEWGIGLYGLQQAYQRTVYTDEPVPFLQHHRYEVVLDTFVQHINGKDSVMYLKETRDSTSVSTVLQATQRQESRTAQYLQVPLHIGFSWQVAPRLWLTPRAGVVLGALLHATKGTNPSPWLLNYQLQLQLGYQWSPQWALLARTQWQGGLAGSYVGKPSLQDLLVGLGCAFFWDR